MEHCIKGLMTGNFRSWGPTQFKQYHSLLGKWGKVGIEIETTQNDFSAQVFRGLQDKGFEWSYRNNPIGSEITYLYDVTNPITVYKTLQRTWVDLLQHGFMLYGSMHLNFQMHIDIVRAAVRQRSWYSTVIIHGVDGEDMFRLENKGGITTTSFTDTLIQFLTMGAYLHGGYTLSNKIFDLCCVYRPISLGNTISPDLKRTLVGPNSDKWLTI